MSKTINSATLLLTCSVAALLATAAAAKAPVDVSGVVVTGQ